MTNIKNNNLWKKQTQLAIENFEISSLAMPIEVIHALAYIKVACAKANQINGKLDNKLANAIIISAKEIAQGMHDKNFPLTIWQSGSGTQTNMNVNEVIASLVKIKSKVDVHENDHVNMSQSTNDTFACAMNISVIIKVNKELMSPINELSSELWIKIKEYKDVIKIGRTHMQDAVPMRLSQEFAAWNAMLNYNKKEIIDSLEPLKSLPLGGSAIGTGLNTFHNFDLLAIKELSNLLDINFRKSVSKFYEQSTHDALLNFHGKLRTFATSLNKMVNDIRLLSSGPHGGIGELILKGNEPGSSIMPGKVNPTQIEMMNMVCAKVIANDSLVTFANSQGQLQLNTYRPIIIYSIIESIDLLAKGIKSLTTKCIINIEANRKKIDEHMNKSLMLITVITPIVGYEKSTKIVELATKENITLKEAVLKLGYLNEKEFDLLVNPSKMC